MSVNEDNEGLKTAFKLISESNVGAFTHLFNLYYDRLVQFALQHLKSGEDAEEAVARTFENLWYYRKNLSTVSYPKVYLYKSVKNACTKNQSREISKIDVNDLQQIVIHTPTPEAKELEEIIRSALNALPEQRQIIFRLVKEEGLKCRDVAEILGISTRTVENQLFRAINSLADDISRYLGYNPKTGKEFKLNTILLLITM